MKNRIRGFTIIELIVVIAIIGILACILIPSMIGFMTNAKATRMNANAKSIYNAAQLAITDSNSAQIGSIQPNCVYTGSDDAIAHPDGGGKDCDLTNYLGDKFDGYFLFVTDTQGYGCVYALWSATPIPASAAVHMTDEDVKNSLVTSAPRGCHPLKTTS